ncbi:hypothetical protein ADU37_CDS21560 [Thermococcus sp. 2319x1]|nr:hypothetical protein ADU37_CDS21560 [Thermococcus sp. 2319x1]
MLELLRKIPQILKDKKENLPRLPVESLPAVSGVCSPSAAFVPASLPGILF